MSKFENNIICMYGRKGKAWLAKLEETIQEISSQWSLTKLKPLNNLSYNYVLSGYQGHRPIILKIGFDGDVLKKEAKTLKYFASYGGVQVLDQQKNVLLLEQAILGKSLKLFFLKREQEAIQIFCDVVKILHQAPVPSSGDFPHIRDWLSLLDKDWKIKEFYLEKARELRKQLLETSKQEILLHGDLHHENILWNGDCWVVIDPKGVIGENSFDVAAFIRNPISDLLNRKDVKNIITKRIVDISKILSLDAKRVEQWCFVQALLAWIWALEDGCDPSSFSRLTEIFYDLC